MICEDPDGLCQFESMLSLTNLSSLGPTLRSHIVASQAVPIFESHLLSSHVLIRRAATECLCNLMYEESVFERYVSSAGTESQRLKIMVALSDTDDVQTNRAASGVLAVLSGVGAGCEALLKEPRFGEVVMGLVTSGNGELEHRGLECVKNVLVFAPDKKAVVISRPVLEIVVLRASSAGPLQSVAQEILSHLSK